MKGNHSPIGVIYRVGDLKTAFVAVKDSLSSKDDPSKDPSDLIPSLLGNISTGVLLLRAFNDEDYLALPAIPTEIARATDPLSLSFQEYYKQGKFAIIPSEMAQKLE